MSSSQSLSSYRTPLCSPLSKHSDHRQPINKDETESGVVKRSTELSKHAHYSLVARMEKAEQENAELKEMISGLKQKLEKLETEGHKEKHEATTPDREGLLKNTASQLPQNRSVSTDVLVWLAKHVTQWKFLARRLHLQESDIQQIEANYSNDIREQSYQMLLKWKLTCSNASYHTLGEAVREECGETLYCDYVTMVREAEEAASD